jgi:hypothetical protein
MNVLSWIEIVIAAVVVLYAVLMVLYLWVSK